MSGQPYNNALVRLFEKPQNFLDFLHEFVQWSHMLDIDPKRLYKHDPTYIDEQGKKTVDDIVYRYLDSQGQDYFFVITEPQASVDQTMAFRAADYRHSVRKQHFYNATKTERERVGFRLPTVEVIVLYHGAARWTAPLSVNAMQTVAITQRSVDPDYTLIDLGHMDSEELVEEHRSLITAALSLFPAAHEDRFTDVLQKIIDEIIPHLDKEQREEWIIFLTIAFEHHISGREIEMLSDFRVPENLLTSRPRFEGDPFPKMTERRQREIREEAVELAKEMVNELAKEMVNELAKEMADELAKEIVDERALEIARELLDVLDIPTIAKKTGLSVDAVSRLKAEIEQS